MNKNVRNVYVGKAGESVWESAEQVAKALGVPMSKFIMDALRLRLTQDPYDKLLEEGIRQNERAKWAKRLLEEA